MSAPLAPLSIPASASPATPVPRPSVTPEQAAALVADIRRWGEELGFGAVGIADLDLHDAGERMKQWLAQGMHGDMEYLERNMALRQDPSQMVPHARSAIMVRMQYAPASGPDIMRRQREGLADGERAVVASYALGRDYHKVLRNRLQKLADRIEASVGAFGYRVFTDSAPVMEVELARKAGLGWRGKHTLLLSREGSWFFLGEILTDLVLPPDPPMEPHCGGCRRCIVACPTQAIVAPYVLDARRCISYLTIELAGSIPEPLRPLIGTRIYGCDDCQTACPWNKFAQPGEEPDFAPRQQLDASRMVDLFGWSKAEFEARTAGSAIRRIGHERWLRNLAVGLGNARPSAAVRAALQSRADDDSAVVREHVAWALARQEAAQSGQSIQSGIVNADSTVPNEMSIATSGPLPPIRVAST
jgi:epoxyqueuosine reductase